VKMEDSRYFTGRGWGVLRTDARSVYEACRLDGKSFVVVRDGLPYESVDILESYFKEITGMMRQQTWLNGSQKSNLVLDSQNVLKYFLRVHRHRMIGRRVVEDVQEKDYRFTEVIFVELNTHLSYTVEYLLLVFKYLLRQALRMPQLFVVCDYPTDEFNFIDMEILESPVVPWRRSVLFDRDMWSRTELTPSEELVRQEVRSVNKSIHVLGSLQTVYDKMKGDSVLCVIVSMNNIYGNKIRSVLGDLQVSVYEDIDSYLGVQTHSVTRNIITLASIDDLLNAPPRIKPSIIIYDTRFKVGVNMLYAGNIPMPVHPNDSYVKMMIWKIRQIDQYKNSDLYIYDIGKEPIVRGIFSRSPIIDYMQLHMFGIDMILLYNNYYVGQSVASFLSVVRSEVDVIRTLHFDEPFYNREVPGNGHSSPYEKCVLLNIHPMMISLIESWIKRKLPRVCILVFTAVMLTADRPIVEIREHGTREHENDVSQTSHYGRVLYEYLQLMETHGSVVMEEGGRTSRLLKRLLDIYDIKDDEMLLFNYNEFTHQLVKIIIEDYQPFILTHWNQSSYRGKYNTQMNWTIMQNTNTPQQLLTIKVSMGSTKRQISLYIPLDRV